MVYRTVPLVALGDAFHVLVTAAPAGKARVTAQPRIAGEPAVTFTLAVKPPCHWFTDTDAEQPLVGGVDEGVDEGVVEGVVEGVDEGVVEGVGPPARVGVCQVLHWDKSPSAKGEILNTPGALPVLSKNFWMFCCRGAVHSGRRSQWLPS